MASSSKGRPPSGFFTALLDTDRIKLKSFTCIALLISLILIIAAVLVQFLILPQILRSELGKMLPVLPDSEIWKGLRDPPADIYVEYWLWNVTNSIDFMAGRDTKPMLSQVGPFKFKEKRLPNTTDTYRDLDWHPNGTYSYREQRFLYFLPNEGRADLLNSTIFQLDLVLAGFVSNIRMQLKPIEQRLVWPFFKARYPNESSLIRRITPYQFIFGKEEKRLADIKELLETIFVPCGRQNDRCVDKDATKEMFRKAMNAEEWKEVIADLTQGTITGLIESGRRRKRSPDVGSIIVDRFADILGRPPGSDKPLGEVIRDGILRLPEDGLNTIGDDFISRMMSDEDRKKVIENIPESSFISTFTGEREKNGSTYDLYTLFTGERNIDDFMRVNVWNGKTKLDNWNTEEANTIKGTTGGGFKPMSNGEDLHMFVGAMCRSMKFDYDYDHELKGIDVRRYEMSQSIWQDFNQNIENWGYCPTRSYADGTNADQSDPTRFCLDEGLMSAHQCMGDTKPIVYSTPHFLQSSNKVKSFFDGLSPNSADHLSFFDVEPVTGSVLHFHMAIQINWPILYLPDLHGYDRLPHTQGSGLGAIGREPTDLIPFPVMWVNQTVFIHDIVFTSLQSMLFDLLKFVKIGCDVIVAVGAFGVLAALIYHAYRTYQDIKGAGGASASIHAKKPPQTREEVQNSPKTPRAATGAN